MTKKITKREMFEQIKGVLTDPTQIAFIEHELELLTKKNAGDRKPTATQKENIDLKNQILNLMENDKMYTITDMMKEFDCLNGLSNQRVSALVRQLKEDNLVQRIEEKRKAYFVKVGA